MHDPAGAWELPQELVMLRDTIRRFMQEEVKPVEDTLEHDAYTPPPGQLADLQRKARDLGLWLFETPAEHGGPGLNLLGQCVAAEETAKCRMGAYIAGCGAFGFDPPNVIWKGTEHQQRFARKDVANGTKAFVAISEPSGGSDPGRAIQTRAERKSDRYVINGTKIWISGAGMADWGIVFARVGESKGRDGITSFVVDKSKPGISLSKIPVIRSYSPYEVHFNDYEVPIEDRLGEEGKGFKTLLDGLNAERVLIAAECIGDGYWFIDRATKYAKDRVVFGRPIGQNQGVQFPIADAFIELEAANLMRWKACEKIDAMQNAGAEANMAKYLAAKASWEAANVCLQTHGGFGFAAEYDIERKFRETRLYQVAPISTNLILSHVGTHVLGMPKSF